uniref:Uncharacterized protein n=1 Tax=Rhizophora mucronata TaxID=61149 RepID=A0A2P2R4P1_RHIMU
MEPPNGPKKEEKAINSTFMS